MDDQLKNGIKAAREKLKRLEELESGLHRIAHAIKTLETHSPCVMFGFGDGSELNVPTDASMRSAVGRELDRMKRAMEQQVTAVLNEH